MPVETAMACPALYLSRTAPQPFRTLLTWHYRNTIAGTYPSHLACHGCVFTGWQPVVRTLYASISLRHCQRHPPHAAFLVVCVSQNAACLRAASNAHKAYLNKQQPCAGWQLWDDLTHTALYTYKEGGSMARAQNTNISRDTRRIVRM